MTTKIKGFWGCADDTQPKNYISKKDKKSKCYIQID